MKKYLQKVKNLIPAFYSFCIKQVLRQENARANALSKLAALVPHNLCAQVFFDVLEEPSINKLLSMLQLDTEPCWMDPLIQYLHDETLPPNREEIHKV